MQKLKIALAGKPNSGKSSLFNLLTGLRQKIGNFPGVTVDKRAGICKVSHDTKVEITDLPGVYSLYSQSEDEKIVANVLLNTKNDSFPDTVVVVGDATNLQSSLLLLLQLVDLNFPVILALNMIDMLPRLGQRIDTNVLSNCLGVPVVPISARNGQGIDRLKEMLVATPKPPVKKNYHIDQGATLAIEAIKHDFKLPVDYLAFQYLQQVNNLDFLVEQRKVHLVKIVDQFNLDVDAIQSREMLFRYRFIQKTLEKVIHKDVTIKPKKNPYRLDKIVTHKIWGHLIFFCILLLVFQSVFSWAQVPMDWIDGAVTGLISYLEHQLPAGALKDLLTRGLLPGIGGVVIFIPQIAILFMYIAILEGTGYMSRIIFLMDNIMRKFGMNGRSVVPLISGWACAIPAIMATRTIKNWKDRLITLLVTPLMSCSARLPVYTILIALIVSEGERVGFFDIRGLMLMGLYMLGTLAVFVSAWVMKKVIKQQEPNLLLMELPPYRFPKWSHIGLIVLEKVKIFVWKAGKIIVTISIVLWFLASYGPPKQMEKAKEKVNQELQQGTITAQDVETKLKMYKLEYSYAGRIGKMIEPAIMPLGYDWKIGIALLSSLAAREVFVGTIATLYSVGSDSAVTIKRRLQQEKNSHTGQPQFNRATVLSLLVFYTFAMQCMSTLAVVKRETKAWKWPIIQLLYMTVLAYLSALVVYQVMV